MKTISKWIVLDFHPSPKTHQVFFLSDFEHEHLRTYLKKYFFYIMKTQSRTKRSNAVEEW